MWVYHARWHISVQVKKQNFRSCRRQESGLPGVQPPALAVGKKAARLGCNPPALAAGKKAARLGCNPPALAAGKKAACPARPRAGHGPATDRAGYRSSSNSCTNRALDTKNPSGVKEIDASPACSNWGGQPLAWRSTWSNPAAPSSPKRARQSARRRPRVRRKFSRANSPKSPPGPSSTVPPPWRKAPKSRG